MMIFDHNQNVITGSRTPVHHPRRHAAIRTSDYIFNQLIPYIGNKRRLLHLIEEAVDSTGLTDGMFVDMFTGSSVVARWAKRRGFGVVANDWEPYSYQIARCSVGLNHKPAFKKLGGADAAINHLNQLPPCCGYVATHLCPADDEHPDPSQERMFFTQANGQRIDAIRQQIETWQQDKLINEDELAYLLAPLIYAVSYASNTSGVFKGFHNGWGGKTGTALYRILRPINLQPPVLYDNGQTNIALRQDAQQLASSLKQHCKKVPDIIYIDPPYNQHPYGSNYHVLNTVTLWDKPPLNPQFMVDGKKVDKSAIRKDWRTLRRSPYNHSKQASDAFEQLINPLNARHILVSYSTDGNIPLADLLTTLANKGQLRVFAKSYKRYRVSTQRMSEKSHNVEFVATVNTSKKSNANQVDQIVEQLYQQEADALL